MNYSVFELIKKRSRTGFGSRIADSWLTEASKSTDEKICIVLPEHTLIHPNRQDREAVDNLLLNHQLCAMFDLQNPLPTTNVRLNLFVFSKVTHDIAIGVFNSIAPVMIPHIKARVIDEFSTSIFSQCYNNYLDCIQKFIDTGKLCEDSDYWQFNFVNRGDVDKQVLLPRRYCKRVSQIEDALKSENIVNLQELADIIRPKPIAFDQHTAQSLKASACKYPFDYRSLRYGVLTNCPLQKNDIIFIESGKYYLLDEVPSQEIYASPHHYIIRPRRISPAYLLLYLNSETARSIIESYVIGSAIRRVRISDIKNLPVIVPDGLDEDYYRIFKLRYYKTSDISDFKYEKVCELLQHLNKPQETISEKSANITAAVKEQTSIESILAHELVANLRVYKQTIIQEFLESDLRELNVCFQGKAYKATLIMAGSILEAVLIDWLSEKHNKNYFSEEYQILDKYGNQRRADLIDYINAIKEIEKPNWMNAANKAHVIRKKRNLVHAKLCLITDEINEDTCRQVIDYLRDVLKTRGKR